VLTYAALVRDGLAPDDPMRADVDEILHAAWRATDLTRQLLSFGRPRVPELRVLDLNAVVADMDRMIRRMVGPAVEVEVVPGALGRVKLDPGHLEQIVINLARNARDAMPHGGRLTLETTDVAGEPHAWVRLTVRDTGVGMDDATQARIFEAFFTTKPADSGTGLGLGMVYAIVEQAGGRIAVRSQPGRGATFDVDLPRTSDASAPAPAPESPTDLRGSGTVLVVEDDDGLRSTVCGVLERNGYQVLEAPGAGKALRLCQTFEAPIDLLVTDVAMPQLGGRELARRLQAMRPRLPVLYLSGHAEDAQEHTLVVGAGIGVLDKPITPERLLRAVRAVLAGAGP
jgi:two-component system cell cycle sensor histidine kinase/response regulator CckA